MFKSVVKSMVVAFGLFSSANVFANVNIFNEMYLQTEQSVMVQAQTMGLNWQKGEKNEYTLEMAIIKGSMIMEVRDITSEGIWVDQNIDLGFAGKQEAQTLFDKDTGAIKKMLVGGKEQEIPKNNSEVIETKEDKITVPAGTFDCIHARIKDKSDNKESNLWVNPLLIPISGMLKMVRPMQFGTMTAELTTFVKK